MVEDIVPRLETFGYWTPTQVADWYEDAGYPRPTREEAAALLQRAGSEGLGTLQGDCLVCPQEPWTSIYREVPPPSQ